MNIKDQIRAEIRRMHEEHTTSEYRDEAALVLEELEDFLDTLPEQTVSGKLPDDIFKKEYAKFSNDPDAGDYAFPIDLADYKDFARHFYELGQQSRPKISDTSLEEEMDKYYDSPEWDGEPVSWMTFTRIARHFAEWQKAQDQKTIELAEDHAMLAGMNKMEQQMLEGAVEGEVSNVGYPTTIQLRTFDSNFMCGEKVRFIIVKEDEK